MIDVAITTLLSSRSGLDAARVSPSTSIINVKDEVLPRLAFTRTPGGEQEYTDDGPTGVRNGLFQLDIFANTLAEGLATVNRLKRSAAASTNPGLDNYSGTIDTTTILWISITDDLQYETTPVRDGQNRAIVRVSQPINVNYREAIA